MRDYDLRLCEPFFKTHFAFRAHEFQAYLAEKSVTGVQRYARILRKCQDDGRIQRLKRGLYIPSGKDDPAPALQYIASRMTSDAVLAYHTALQCYGGAYSVWFHSIYAARHPARPLRVRSGLIRGTTFPKALTDVGREDMETTRTYCGRLRVTTIERTLVDIVDRPRLCGGWDEVMHGYDRAALIYPYLEPGKTIDVRRMVAYTLALRRPGTCAKVGFILDFCRDEWGFDADATDPLQDHLPRRGCDLERSRNPYDAYHYCPKWRLAVPNWVLARDWRQH